MVVICRNRKEHIYIDTVWHDLYQLAFVHKGLLMAETKHVAVVFCMCFKYR